MELIIQTMHMYDMQAVEKQINIHQELVKIKCRTKQIKIDSVYGPFFLEIIPQC